MYFFLNVLCESNRQLWLPSIASTRERTRIKHVFTWRQTSAFQVSTLKFSHPNVKFPRQLFAVITVKMCAKFAKIPSLTCWEPKKHRGLLREVDEDLFLMLWWITKQRPSWELHIWVGKLQILTPETHTFDVIWRHVLWANAFMGRCNRWYVRMSL